MKKKFGIISVKNFKKAEGFAKTKKQEEAPISGGGRLFFNPYKKNRIFSIFLENSVDRPKILI